LLACVAGRHTVDLETLTRVQAWPLAALAALQLPLGLWRRSYWRTVLGSAASITALGASGLLAGAAFPSRYVLGHASAVLFLLAAAVYDDRWARLVRRLALPLIPLAGLIAATTYEFLFPQVPRAQHAVYLAALLAVAAIYWWRRSATPQLLALLVNSGGLLLFGSRSVYLLLESSRLDKGLPWIAGGLTALGVALLVSFMKAGLLARGWLMLRSLNKN
jgi:hypothetical protein